MPSIVSGPFKVNTNSGVLNFGDTLNISPKSIFKEVRGSGGGNTGDFMMTNNGISISTAMDPDIADQTQANNA
ncbi:spore germination protein [Pseudobacillus sp. FSL P4-0506]|uniref:spore germination protein n=1 Tax=unclassified Pseudobacillus TaxID=2619284 RepID=UPI0030F8CDCA